MKQHLKELSNQLEGELYWDDLHKTIYATDASVYRIVPLAVAFPKNEEDIRALCAFAKVFKTSLIPRTAGTSLAGQVVGEGIVVDVSKYLTKIIAHHPEKQTVVVQPGVIRDELNDFLKPFGQFFGPNTSTSNRCMLGGMVGNNSSGTTSIRYGVTRDYVQKLRMVLWDGTVITIENLDREQLAAKCALQTTEGAIYRELIELLSPKEVQEEIIREFPKEGIHRRNTGYAVDALLKMQPFSRDKAFNLCALITGSEGTLGIVTEISLQTVPLSSLEGSMVAVHFESISQCMKAVVPIMKHHPVTCEMMDRVILNCTKDNRAQLPNRFFVEGDPAAILLVEVESEREEKTQTAAHTLIKELQEAQLGYAYPVLIGKEIQQALELRKAGLGLLGNIVGDRKAVACIEDTAVALEDLESYINDFSVLMEDFGQEAVYYAHAGAGELHLRPILNLKKGGDVALFREITEAVAQLVKKYKGSLSGEHGDGIVRAEFIERMIGQKNYKLLKAVKQLFDPHSIFNPGKIVAPLPMDKNLRYVTDRKEPTIDTLLDFSESQGILRSAEKCNGSGDCRKLPASGGTMCPSYRATRDEKDTTRARANALREFLTTSSQENKFNHGELKEVFDLCISCKACASECPSNVDVATLKAEFEYQYQKENGSSLRTKLFAHNTRINRLGALFPGVYNAVLKGTSGVTKSVLGIAAQRSLPRLDVFRFKELTGHRADGEEGRVTVHLFIDEFSQYLDGAVAQDAYELLKGLGYSVELHSGMDSGRSFISKGFLKQAKEAANKNITYFNKQVRGTLEVVVGIEPSAILTFRDEYLKLADNKEEARQLADRSFLIEEFLHQEIKNGSFTPDNFTQEIRKIKIHGHCHQKALSSIEPTFAILNLPKNYTPTIIPSGCCGMAGSFGYEKEHYDVSLQIGEETLLPAVRKASSDTLIAANGTSCRHQIKDGTAREALHPLTILRRALKA